MPLPPALHHPGSQSCPHQTEQTLPCQSLPQKPSGPPAGLCTVNRAKYKNQMIQDRCLNRVANVPVISYYPGGENLNFMKSHFHMFIHKIIKIQTLITSQGKKFMELHYLIT